MLFSSKEKIRFNNYMGLWINEKAFIAGTGVVAVFALTAVYLSTTFFVNLGSLYTPLLSSLFIGTVMGHHLGTSTEKEGKTSSSFWLGASLALALIALSTFQVSVLSAILLITTVTVFLIHNSGLGVQNTTIDRMTDYLARFSKFGLFTIGIYHYVVPLLVDGINFVAYNSSLFFLLP